MIWRRTRSLRRWAGKRWRLFGVDSLVFAGVLALAGGVRGAGRGNREVLAATTTVATPAVAATVSRRGGRRWRWLIQWDRGGSRSSERFTLDPRAAGSRGPRPELSHELARNLEEVVISLPHVGLVRRQVRVDKYAGRITEVERDSDAPLVPQGCAGRAEAKARRYGRRADISQQRDDPSVSEDGVVCRLFQCGAQEVQWEETYEVCNKKRVRSPSVSFVLYPRVVRARERAGRVAA